MNSMNKVILLSLLIILLLAFFVAGYKAFSETSFYRTYTSAICLDNVCRDYLFTCLDGEIIKSNPISGFVTFDEDWIDKREDKNRC